MDYNYIKLVRPTSGMARYLRTDEIIYSI